MGETLSEFEGGGKAGLLVHAAQVADKVDDSGLVFEIFAEQGLQKCQI
jgi:hypothetical protein